MKYLLFVTFIAVFFVYCNSNSGTKQKEKQGQALYNLPLPAGWTKEVFPIPMNFAPEINYKGHEEIRFAPGWADSTKRDYWTYGFLWCLDNDPLLNDSIVAANLKYYYNGLVRSNSRQFHIPNSKLNTTETAFEKTAAADGDLQAYQGTITMIDYMRGIPQVLHAKVHVSYCKAVGKYMVFNEISPQPFSDPVWTSLSTIWAGFECGKSNQ